MIQPYSLKIDAFSHITPLKYIEALSKAIAKAGTGKANPTQPIAQPLYDLDYRFRIMDNYDGLVQVLTLGFPAVEEVVHPDEVVDLVKLANDTMAELVLKYPYRFIAAIAYLPMTDIDAALKEADRAINDLKCRGVYVNSHVNGKPLDSAEYIPLFEKMSQYSLPIYIHPHRKKDFADYKTEKESKYDINSVFGWLYDTTAAMTP